MLYLILFIYLIVAGIYPIAGWAAIICMIGPVWMSVYRGRYWCGHICPRGSFYTRLISRISLHRRIPAVLRTVWWRSVMVGFIFTMFGVQMYFAWGDWAAMGRVFWVIILVTTLVGILLGILFAPRAWCSFCPMGSLSALVAPRSPRPSFRNIHVSDACALCKRCSRECPMQLTPYDAKGQPLGLLDADCIKCEYCVRHCAKGAMTLRSIR